MGVDFIHPKGGRPIGKPTPASYRRALGDRAFRRMVRRF
jgi:hypothetical protein